MTEEDPLEIIERQAHLAKLKDGEKGIVKDLPFMGKEYLLIENEHKAMEAMGIGPMRPAVVSAEIRKKNKVIEWRYNRMIKEAIDSYIHMGFDPEEDPIIDIPGIIKKLKPTKEHLYGYRLKHFIPAKHFDLSDPSKIVLWAHPANLDLVPKNRKIRSDRIQVDIL